MAQTSTCPQCGASYEPSRSPGGLCPACLMARGLEHEQDAGPARAAGPAGATPSAVPAPEVLAPHFPQLVIEDLIGRGGMGAVYRARQAELDRTVALKILPGLRKHDPSFAERFRREARALATLNHPGIVQVYDSGQAADWVYFVMEYVDGANLRQILDDGPVAPALALTIVGQICDSLQYAHGQGVVHRDIKPENILVDQAGKVKIVDFGLVRLVGTAQEEVNLTRTGQAMGTPHYMAPEQWKRPQEVDHRADIYSLGVVFYELLTGELPLGHFEPPSHSVQVDVRMDKVVLKALEVEPGRRYQRTSEIKTDLDQVLDSAVPRAPGPDSKAPASRTGELEGAGATLLKAAWCLALSGLVLAVVWTWHRLQFGEPTGDARSEYFFGGAGVAGVLGLIAWLCHARVLSRESELGITGPRLWFRRSGVLPCLCLITFVGFIYASSARQDTPLTESAWMGAPILLLICLVGGLSRRLGPRWF